MALDLRLAATSRCGRLRLALECPASRNGTLSDGRKGTFGLCWSTASHGSEAGPGQSLAAQGARMEHA